MCDDEEEDKKEMRKNMLTDAEIRICRGFDVVRLMEVRRSWLTLTDWSMVFGVRPLRRAARGAGWMANIE